MARLVFWRNSNTHPDPTINEREMVKAGDLVAIREDDDPYTKVELDGRTFTRRAIGPASLYQDRLGASTEESAGKTIPVLFARYRYDRTLSRLMDKEGRDVRTVPVVEDPDPRTR